MYKYKAKLIRVIDADSIEVELDLGFNIFIKQRVILAGITKLPNKKDWGSKAKERVIEILDEVNGQFILISEMHKNGKYGGIIGRIQLPLGREVNEILINEGLATRHLGDTTTNHSEYKIK